MLLPVPWPHGVQQPRGERVCMSERAYVQACCSLGEQAQKQIPDRSVQKRKLAFKMSLPLLGLVRPFHPEAWGRCTTSEVSPEGHTSSDTDDVSLLRRLGACRIRSRELGCFEPRKGALLSSQ